MAGFKCPFCGQVMSVNSGTLKDYFFDFFHAIDKTLVRRDGYCALRLSIYRCPNESCQKETIIASGENGYIDGKIVMIEPEVVFNHYPEYIPPAIRNDYEEGRMILHRSPKAAATLARRCLQGMIRDFWGITGKRNLFEEIEAIKDRVPPTQWQAIDALRNIGNIGAHMQQDVNLMVTVDLDEAEKLLQLIELLMEKWYISRRAEEELYSSIIQVKDEKELQKKK